MTKEKEYTIETSLDEKNWERFLEVKKQFGLKKNSELIRVLISDEYARIKDVEEQLQAELLRNIKSTVELPLGVYKFLGSHGEDPKEYFRNAIIDQLGAHIDALKRFGFENLEEAKLTIAEYNLSEVLKDTVADYR